MTQQNKLITTLNLHPSQYTVSVYEAGDNLIRQGSPVSHILFVTDGVINLQQIASNGKNPIMANSISHCILGVEEYLTNTPNYLNDAFARTRVRALLIPASVFRELIGTNIDFVRYIAVELAFQMRRSSRELLIRHTRSAEERLCLYLIREAENGIYTNTLSIAAGAIGSTYRHVWRLMQKLCREGILEKQSDGYHILNPGKLQALARKSG